MQSLVSLYGSMTSISCLFGILMALYASISSHSGSSPRRVDFLIGGGLFGTYMFGQLMPFFGEGLSMFQCLGFFVVLTGALIGGVVGVLLPKTAAGLSLGVFISLFVVMLLETASISFSSMETMGIFTLFIPICLYFVSVNELVAVPLRTALGCGMSLAMVAGTAVGDSFVDTMYSNLGFSVPESANNISVISAGVWVMGMIGSFLIQSELNGNLRKWWSGSYEPLPTSSSLEFKFKASEQRTFSYPDTLENNYFDLDNLPRHLQAVADVILNRDMVMSLASKMGFQVDNSRNQAEHLLMMLSNECKQGEHILTEPPNRLHGKLFSNYKKWCDRMGESPVFTKSAAPAKLPHIAQIEDMLLFLLIWGEAANLRHMPECLCFLFHKTAKFHQNQSSFKENLYPGYFLDHVVTPIYDVLATGLSKKGDHENRKSYDDFNEFFWSPSCLKYEIFHSSKDIAEANTTSEPVMLVAQALATSPKTYVEKRSYFHGILSFHRVLEWHAIAFTLLICYGFSTTLVWTRAYTFQIASVIFIQINIFGIIWISLEVWSNYPTSTISNPSIYGYLLRLGASYVILIYQCIYFYWSFDSSTPNSLDGESQGQGNCNFWWWQYIWLSAFALIVYATESVICFVPSIASALLCWNNDMVQSVLNICYPLSQLYVGKKVHVTQWNVVKYILFWLTLIAWKLYFGYNFITSPVTLPTIELYDDYMNYLDTSFYKTLLLLSIWWIPHFLVFTIDLSIWYSVWSSFVGATAALTQRMGAVRDHGCLREHFMRAPYAFCQRIMPPASSVGVRQGRGPPSQNEIQSIDVSVNAKKFVVEAPKLTKTRMSSNDLSSLLSPQPNVVESETEMHMKVEGSDLRMSEFLDIRTQRWVVFSRVWNEFMRSLRNADHMSHAEIEKYAFSSFDWLSKPVYLPLFQTAGLLEQAVIKYVDSNVAYHAVEKPQNKLLVWENLQTSLDVATKEAVGEAWELTSWSLNKLVGNVHASDMNMLVSCISKWAMSDDLYAKLNADSLNAIVDQVASIISTLKGSLSKRKKSPLATPEVVKVALAPPQAGGVGELKRDSMGSEMKGTGALKKSVSTGFLTALQSESTSQQEKPSILSASNPPMKPKFEKLQPFRKVIVLTDLVRDKIRDDFRGLLNCIKGALNRKDTKDLVDRITFILSMENGFWWNDVYASAQIDEFACDPNAAVALGKLYGLLKLRQTQVTLSSTEAQRRINFFVNSLFMDMPVAPSVRYSKEYSVMTPFYSEDVLLTREDLEQKNEDGVTTLLYLKTLYKKDWSNFLERTGVSDDLAIWSSKHVQQTRMWASMRAQTLFKTVDGMMQTELAIRLLADLEQLSAPDIQLYTKLKFQYVVACQVYGQMKKNLEHKADDIEFLLAKYPNLRIAYIDAVRFDRSGEMSYYSVLVKADPNSNQEPAAKGNKVKEVLRVKLPGNPVLGEGKPENQNHAIIFSRGRYLQAIDMNQDGYFEEAIKMRNLLEEFEAGHAIVGFREHIFTGTVSSVANYMALQETSFVTLGQRVLTDPLNIRQHYGHPDIFDKMFIMTEGGMSKASRGINLSEDVFAGFNATIRGHTVGFKEYVQVGKGRDVGLQQTYKFEAKLAQGNAEQTLTRDMYRICERLDFFRLMSFYYGGVGHYVANAMIMFTLITLVYFMLGLAVFDQEGIDGRPMAPEGPIQLALAGMGLLQTMPLVMVLVVEKGVASAAREIGYMFLSGGPLYFIFQIQTKSYFFQQTILAGGASYKATGRGFVTRHSPFDENYRFFASSHIYLGFELMIALVLYKHYSVTHQYLGLTWSLWLVTIAFLFGPFWFNPLSFETTKVVEDYGKWTCWMNEVGGTADQSWESWYKEEIAFIKPLTLSWKVFLAVTRCTIWIVLGVGIAGPKFLSDSEDKEKFSAVFFILGVYYLGNWVITQLDRAVSYAVRRFSALFLSFVCIGLLLYLFHAHKKYFGYTLSFYYIGSSISFFSLLFGFGNPSFLYKMHDYIVGHAIFLVLYVLSIVQLGILQTWLLYHNALSSGVAIDDILKYASRSKERGGADSETVIELRNQIADQERVLHSIFTNLESSERTALLAPSSGKVYGSAAVSIPYQPLKVQIPPKAAIKPNSSAEKSATASDDISSISSLPPPPPPPPLLSLPLTALPNKAKATIVEDITVDSPPVDPSFVFKQPTSFPKR